jgi:hypothetical protein
LNKYKNKINRAHHLIERDRTVCKSQSSDDYADRIIPGERWQKLELVIKRITNAHIVEVFLLTDWGELNGADEAVCCRQIELPDRHLRNVGVDSLVI